MSIGTLARATRVGIDTIRYYERERLLPKPRRSASGYRIYDANDVQRLRFIRRAKALGFKLDEIRELLALSRDDERGVRDVRKRAQRHLETVDKRLRELRRVQSGLRRLIAACPGEGSPAGCPILRALASTV